MEPEGSTGSQWLDKVPDVLQGFIGNHWKFYALLIVSAFVFFITFSGCLVLWVKPMPGVRPGLVLWLITGFFVFVLAFILVILGFVWHHSGREERLGINQCRRCIGESRIYISFIWRDLQVKHDRSASIYNRDLQRYRDYARASDDRLREAETHLGDKRR